VLLIEILNHRFFVWQNAIRRNLKPHEVKTTMLMIIENRTNTSGVSYTYEQTDMISQRAARMQFSYWSSFFNQMEDNESFLLSRFNLINNYVQTIKHDEYIANLYLVLLGSRGEGVPLTVALSRMEKVRKLIVEQSADEPQNNFSATVIPEVLNDARPRTKIKYLMRYVVAMHLANLLYQKLKQQRLKNKSPEIESEFNFLGNPYMFAKKLESFLSKYR
jgi:hypothetical protein